MQRDSRGFSWMEVILIILITVLILMIALPNLIKPQSDLNQSEAVRSLHRINGAETNYVGTYNTGFSPNLTVLGPSPSGVPTASMAGFIDSILNTGTKEGYTFTYNPGPRDSDGKITSYTITATPTQPGTSGKSYYFSDGSGVIRMNPSSAASVADTPIGG